MNTQMLNGCIPALMTPCQSDHSADHDAVVRKGRTQGLDQAMAVLPSFDEGEDMVLFCKDLLACLAADGQLKPGTPWVQKSIIGSTYRLSYEMDENAGIIPTIRGRAWVTAEARLHFAPDDPYGAGIGAA